MTELLAIGVGVIAALLLIGGILFVSMRLAERNGGAGLAGWNDNGSGNVDGYGSGHRETYSDFGGGDAGGGGGD